MSDSRFREAVWVGHGEHRSFRDENVLFSARAAFAETWPMIIADLLDPAAHDFDYFRTNSLDHFPVPLPRAAEKRLSHAAS